MLKNDPYRTLGIDRDATQEQAKRRFRILALQYHPDRNPGDKTAEARFKAVQDAWSQLEHVLPRAAIPLEIPEGASEQEIEDAYVQWLMDPRNSQPEPPRGRKSSAPDPPAPGRDSTPDQPQEPAPAEGATVWSTVAGEAAAGFAIQPFERRGDWRTLNVQRGRQSSGLEKISPEKAAKLLDSHPNAFAALKIVQQLSPQFCLYDAILWRAHRARPGQVSSSRALVIVGAAAVDQSRCQEALRDPFASVEVAQENLRLIAPRVKFDGAQIAFAKLELDVLFLKEHIRAVAASLRGGGLNAK